ncbi:putative oxidoreductase [uncultured Thiomicrorhabdus sp.]
MNTLFRKSTNLYQSTLTKLAYFEGLAPLLLRLYLAPIFMQAGWNKLANFSETAEWFGNPEWGLGLPFPELMTALAGGAEFFGGIALIIGLAVRWFSIPLMITMIVAAITVHWSNGWLAISDTSSWLANQQILDSQQQLIMSKELLQTHGNYEWLTMNGQIVILNNGIEFAATYFIMLLSLLFTGGGRYFSLDYWISIWIKKTADKN